MRGSLHRPMLNHMRVCNVAGQRSVSRASMNFIKSSSDCDGMLKIRTEDESWTGKISEIRAGALIDVHLLWRDR
jgi:hypothetical protein